MESMPVGLCQCGCGGETPIAKRTRGRWGDVKGEPKKYLPHHQKRGEGGSNWKGGRKGSHGYILLNMPEHPNARADGYVLEHHVVVSRAMGKPVPVGVHVHHVNGDRADNRPQNLVVCPDAKFHRLLHMRTDALEACGRADYRRCKFCHRWDDPATMYHKPNETTAYHRSCRAAVIRETRRRKIDPRTWGQD